MSKKSSARTLVVGLVFSLMAGSITAQSPSIPEASPRTPPVSIPSAPVRQPSPSPAAPPVEPAPKREPLKWTDVVTAYVAIFAAITAAISAYYSYRTVRQSDATERGRVTTAKSERLSALWSDIQELRFLSPEEISDPSTKEVAEVVRRNVNIMEKIGLWWDANLIDRKITAEEIATSYVVLYEQIQSLGELPALARTGSDLIDENPRAKTLYRDLKQYLAAAGTGRP